MAVVKPAFTVVEHISSSHLSGNKYTVLTSSCGRHDEHHPLTPSPAPSFPHRDTASGTYPTGCCYSSRKQRCLRSPASSTNCHLHPCFSFIASAKRNHCYEHIIKIIFLSFIIFLAL